MDVTEVVEELRTQNRWLRIIALNSLRTIAVETLNSPEKRSVFELSDGVRTVRQIEASSGVNKNQVSRWWREWMSLGLCEESAVHKGRGKKISSLVELGITSEAPRADRASTSSNELGEV